MERYLGLNPLQWVSVILHGFVFVLAIARLCVHKASLIEILGALAWASIGITFYGTLALWHLDIVAIKVEVINLWSTVMHLFSTAYLVVTITYTMSERSGFKEAVNGAIHKVS